MAGVLDNVSESKHPSFRLNKLRHVINPDPPMGSGWGFELSSSTQDPGLYPHCSILTETGLIERLTPKPHSCSDAGVRNGRGESFQEALTLELKILKKIHKADQQSSKGSSRHREQQVARLGGWGPEGNEGLTLPSVSKGKMMLLLETKELSKPATTAR